MLQRMNLEDGPLPHTYKKRTAMSLWMLSICTVEKQWAPRQDFDLILEQFSMAEHYDILMSESSEESESDGDDGDSV